MEHDRLPIPDHVQDWSLAQIEDRDGRDLKCVFTLIDGDRYPYRLPERETPLWVLHEDANRQVSRLRVGHPSHERDLARHPFFLLVRCLGRRIAGIRGPNTGGLPDTDGRSRTGREPDGREDLPCIDHLADRAADRDRLADAAGQAIERAIDRRADRVKVEMGAGKCNQRVGRLDSALGLGDRLRARADHHRVQAWPRPPSAGPELPQGLSRRRTIAASRSGYCP